MILPRIYGIIPSGAKRNPSIAVFAMSSMWLHLIACRLFFKILEAFRFGPAYSISG